MLEAFKVYKRCRGRTDVATPIFLQGHYRSSLNRHVIVGRNYIGIERLKIGELAQLANVTKRTVDYYTNLGLLKAERSAANYRYYNWQELERLRIIVDYKSRNYTLEEIKIVLQGNIEQAELEVESQQLKQKLNDLNEDLQEVIHMLNNQGEKNVVKNHTSHESITLLQSLLLLLL